MTLRPCAPCRRRLARFAVSLRTTFLLSGLSLALGFASATVPAAVFAAAPEQFAAHPYAPHVTEASQRFGIPELWIWAVMRAESRGNSRAVSPAGAMGLMQIMPGTWAMLSARHGLGSDPFDVRANILGGTAYLRAMWDRYGDVSLMLAAYNAGPGRVDDYAAGRRRLPAETVSYIARIAPGLGVSSVAAPAAMPPFDAHPWRQAALFAARGDGEASSNDDGADAQPERPPLASRTATLPSANPAPNPLFVPLSVRNR